MSANPNQFRITGHVISVICAMILGISVCGIVYAGQHQPLTETQFFYLMVYESVVVSAGIAWYAVSLKLSPTGVDVNTTVPQTVSFKSPTGDTITVPAGSKKI